MNRPMMNRPVMERPRILIRFLTVCHRLPRSNRWRHLSFRHDAAAPAQD